MQNLCLNQILSSIKAAAAKGSCTSTYDPLTPSPQGRHLFRSFVNLSLSVRNSRLQFCCNVHRCLRDSIYLRWLLLSSGTIWIKVNWICCKWSQWWHSFVAQNNAISAHHLPCSPGLLFAFVLFRKVKIEFDFHETGQQHFQEAKNLKIAKELEVEQRLMTNRIWFAFFSPLQVCRTFWISTMPYIYEQLHQYLYYSIMYLACNMSVSILKKMHQYVF